jgi:predicted RNA-binding Zn-ribbon protein involved in translation (DUF1610 family)
MQKAMQLTIREGREPPQHFHCSGCRKAIYGEGEPYRDQLERYKCPECGQQNYLTVKSDWGHLA